MTLIELAEEHQEDSYDEGFVAGMNIGHGLANLRVQAERAKWQAKLRRLREKMRRKAYRWRLLADGDWPREWSPDDDERIARHVKIAESTHGLARFTDRVRRTGMTFQAWYMHTAAEFPIAGPKGRLP